MTKTQWDKLRTGDKVLHYEKEKTIVRFAFGGNQAEIEDKTGFRTWVGRTTVSLPNNN